MFKLPYNIQPMSQSKGHEDRVWQIAWHPYTPVLASCSADRTVQILRIDEKGQPSLDSTILTGHKRAVRSVAWAPSGSAIATASFDGTVGIWEKTRIHGTEKIDQYEDPPDWECISTLEGHENECKSVVYSGSGSLLATCGRDKSVWIWEVQPDSDFECLSVLMEHSQDVKFVTWHPHEEILASASYDNSIKLYVDDPADDWYPFSTLVGHASTVWCLSFSPCGEFLSSSSDDETIMIWGRLPASSSGLGGEWVLRVTLRGHSGPVYSLSWGPTLTHDDTGERDRKDLGWLASGGGDGTIRVWDIFSIGDQIQYDCIAQRSTAHNEADVNTVAWCKSVKDHNILATGGDDGLIRIWRVIPEISHDLP